jgi:hypothetical protein
VKLLFFNLHGCLRHVHTQGKQRNEYKILVGRSKRETPQITAKYGHGSKTIPEYNWPI